MKITLKILSVAAVTLVSGCANVDTQPTSKAYSAGHGPPAHAPAHGYRRKHGERRLVFDHEIGVYVVVGLPGHYYHEGAYYRLERGLWEVGSTLDGPWLGAVNEDLPPGLRR